MLAAAVDLSEGHSCPASCSLECEASRLGYFSLDYNLGAWNQQRTPAQFQGKPHQTVWLLEAYGAYGVPTTSHPKLPLTRVFSLTLLCKSNRASHQTLL